MAPLTEFKPSVQVIQLNLALASLMLPVLDRKLSGTALLNKQVVNPLDPKGLVEWCDHVSIF